MEKDIQKLINEFISFVIKQAKCIDNGNPRLGNKYADKYVAVAKSLLIGGDIYINEFEKLLNHESRDVRSMAAAFLLKDRTQSAVRTLKELAKGKDIPAMGARCALERYKKGILEIK